MQLLELEHSQDPRVNFPVLIRSYILDFISCLSLLYIGFIFLEKSEFFSFHLKRMLFSVAGHKCLKTCTLGHQQLSNLCLNSGAS